MEYKMDDITPDILDFILKDDFPDVDENKTNLKKPQYNDKTEGENTPNSENQEEEKTEEASGTLNEPEDQNCERQEVDHDTSDVNENRTNLKKPQYNDKTEGENTPNSENQEEEKTEKASVILNEPENQNFERQEVDHDTSEDEILADIKRQNQKKKEEYHSFIGKKSMQKRTLRKIVSPKTLTLDSSDNEDHEVLANVRRKIKSQGKRMNQRKKEKTFKDLSASETSSADDSCSDPDFVLKKDDVPTSASGSDLGSLVRPKKREVINKKQTNSNKTECWKKKPTALSRKKRNTPGRPIQVPVLKTKVTRRKLFVRRSYLEAAINQAKQDSVNAFQRRQNMREIHIKLLDKLLKSNGLQRIEVMADGNCFFESIIESSDGLNGVTSAADLRQRICDHLTQFDDTYMDFFTSDTVLDKQIYLQQIDNLRKEGHWSNDIADALPLAVANCFNCNIRIFSSKRGTPVIDVVPTVHEFETTTVTIKLAYVAVVGVEHYDGTEKLIISPRKPQETPRKEHTESCFTTPRKQAAYKSPKKLVKSRKRKPDTSKWKRNIKKQRRLQGKQYENYKGKIVQERQIRQCNCTKCRYKCSENVSEECRKELFSVYWNLNSYERQRDFICSCISESKPKRYLRDSKRPKGLSRAYFFEVQGIRFRICKQFFMKTLDIGEKTILYALKYKVGSSFVSIDKRGKTPSHNKTPTQTIDDIKCHIESFPKVESHYTRKDTNRQFLGQDLSVNKMYQLYREECEKARKKPASSFMYRKTFCENYNLSFHTPKKDQCAFCSKFKQLEEIGKLDEKTKADYEIHIHNKERARSEKNLDKDYAKQNNHYHTVTFDLEAVLNTPCSLVSTLYYKRKLSCYNLSIYSLADGRASCYLWDETEGERGSCEIATCLMTYLKSLPPHVRHICFFSDCCSGQNRNQFVTTALRHAVQTSDTILTVDQKFLQSGHTQMECDSMHSAIEYAKKRTSIYIPSQWDTIVRMARRNKPYTVIPMKHQDFLNFKPLAKQTISKVKKDVAGKKIDWLRIKWIQYRKLEPEYIYFKYDFDGEFASMKIRENTRRETSQALPHKYEQRLPISSEKKKDLLSLCKDLIIPEEYHAFYQRLVCVNKTDKLSEPDTLEEDCDSDI